MTHDDQDEARPSGGQLKTATVRGASHLLSAQVGGHALQLIIEITLARLLVPADFGLVGMVLVFSGLAMQFRDFGLSAAAMQADSLTHQQSSNLFWCNVTVSGALSAALIVAAPAIAWVYGSVSLILPCYGLAAVFLAGGIGIQHQATLSRALRFRAIAIARIIGIAGGGCVAVCSACYGAGYWSLVVWHVARPLIASSVMIVLGGWTPKLPRRHSGTRGLLRVGAHVAGYDVINYISRNADKFLIGRLFGEVQLGLYTRAYHLMLLPIAQIRAPVAAVGLPVLSHMRKRPDEFAAHLLGMTRFVAVLCIPVAIGAGFVAEDLISVVLGAKWSGAAPFLTVLAAAGAVQPTQGLLGMAMVAAGHSRRYLYWGIWHTAAVLAAVVAGSTWGTIGIAWGYSVAFLLLWIPSGLYCCRGLRLGALSFFRLHFEPLGTALLAGTVSALTSRHLLDDPVYRLASFSALYAVIYWLPYGISRRRRHEIRDLARSLRRE